MDEYLLDFINTENLGLEVEDIVVRSYDSPMGVATYKTKQEMAMLHFLYFYIRHNCHSNIKIVQYWQKIQVNLTRFEENLLLLQWLSNLCFNLGILNVDKQTANAELKAEKSKQLSR